MRFATGFLWDADVKTFVDNVRAADEFGFDMVHVGDSQSVYRELWVSLAVAAMHTTRARIGPMVTNPVTRHPAVTASAAATLNELSGGRAMLGIGSGDSAVRNLGLRAARVADLEAHIRTLKALLAGDTVDHAGARIHVSWARGSSVPVFVSAEGPRTIRMAGRVADGVVLHTGAQPEIIADSLRILREGAHEVGRDVEEIEVWLYLKAGVGDSLEEAMSKLKMGLASSAHHAFSQTLDGKHLPAGLRPAIQELVRRYDTRAHVVWDGANRSLTDELGLTSYLADRFGLIGTPRDCIDKARAIADAGIENLLLGVVGAAPAATLRRLGADVIPHLAR